MTERSANDVALELAVLKAVEDTAKALTANAKTELGDSVARGTVYATAPGVGEVGTAVVVPDGEDAWAVTDEAAFLAWVKQHRPSAIVEKVRESDQKVILAEIESKGVLPEGVDLVPGRQGYVQVKQTPVQRQRLVDAWRTSQLEAPAFLQIERTSHEAE